MQDACARRVRRSRIAAGLLGALALAACGPSDPVAELRQQQASGDVAGTLEPLRQLVEQHPESGEVYFLYGRALALTGNPSLAEWPLRRAMEDPQWLVPAGLQLARGALDTGNFNTAIDTTTRILEVHPENVQVLLMRASAYAHSKVHPEEALADVDRVLELDPDANDALEPRILALLGLERIEEAEAAIEELGRRIEESGAGPELRGWHCATTAIFADANEELELARERWVDCVERFPQHSNVVQNAVRFYDEQGEPERSIEVLLAALEHAPYSRTWRMMAVERLRKRGRRDEAQALLEEATTVGNAQLAAGAWFDLAAFHAADGETAAELRAARQALELARRTGKPHPDLLLTYADAALRAGQLDEAAAIAEEIDVPAYRELLLARLAQTRGRPAEAIRHYEEGLSLWPDNGFARHQMALAYEALGDFDNAVDAYRYAIRISAGATDARLRVARLLAAGGRLREALAMLNVRRDEGQASLEEDLLFLRLAARLGQAAELQPVIQRFREKQPGRMGLAAAHAAEGLRARGGPVAAVQALRGIEGVDLRSPAHADALRELVRFSAQAGVLPAARADVEAALAAHPDFAGFHEIRGLLLELEGAGPEAALDAYERALALEPGSPHALAARGRLRLAADPEAALADFDRAAAALPPDPQLHREIVHGAVEALLALERAEEAEQRLAALLAVYPYEARAAAILAERRLERGQADERTLDLARRVVRFGGGPEALDLLARVHAERGESEGAREASERARALREAASPTDDTPPAPAG